MHQCLNGAFGSPYSIRETIKLAIPLCIAALGVAVAFKMQFWNIGAEGQIMMGAFAASLFALKFPAYAKTYIINNNDDSRYNWWKFMGINSCSF